MADFPFELVSPEQLVFSGRVEQVVVPGTEGEFGVLAGHAPFVSTLKAGILTVMAGGRSQRLFVRGGFAEARPDGLTVLATFAVPIEQLDSAALAQEVKDAEEDVADATTEAAGLKAQEHLDRVRELRAALGAGAYSGHGGAH